MRLNTDTVVLLVLSKGVIVSNGNHPIGIHDNICDSAKLDVYTVYALCIQTIWNQKLFAPNVESFLPASGHRFGVS